MMVFTSIRNKEKTMKQLIYLILIVFTLPLWGKVNRLEVGLSPSLVTFGDAVGMGVTVFVDYPLLSRFGIDLPLKTRAVLFGERASGNSTSFYNIGAGGGASGYYTFPNLSALVLEGGCDILPGIYGFSYATNNNQGNTLGGGVILAPFLAGSYWLSSSWLVRIDVGYHIGIYDSLFTYLVMSIGGVYAF
jgi:hypothetical protein